MQESSKDEDSVVSCNGGSGGDPLLDPANLGRSDKVFDRDDHETKVRTSGESEVKSEESGVKRKREDGERDRRRGGGKEEKIETCQDSSCDRSSLPPVNSQATSLPVGTNGHPPEEGADLEETGSEEGTPSEKENHPAPLVGVVKVHFLSIQIFFLFILILASRCTHDSYKNMYDFMRNENYNLDPYPKGNATGFLANSNS